MNTTLKKVTELLPILCKSNIVPFIHSSPGLGKSATVKTFAKQFNLKVIDLRLTEMDATDIQGLPYFTDDGFSEFKPFNTFPLENTPIPTGYKGWCIILDEFNSALPSVQSACYKLVLDRMVGQHHLHKKCFIVACGNLETDNAIVHTMSSALISRFAHFTIEVNPDEWTEWAIANGIDNRIISYIGFKPQALYTFNPDATDPYASPRTWSMANELLKHTDDLTALASVIGLGVASEFKQYTKLYNELPKLNDIINNPEQSIPNDLGTQWAVIGYVASNVNKTNAKQLSKYLQQFPMDLQIVAMKIIKQTDVSLLINDMSDWFEKVRKSLYE